MRSKEAINIEKLPKWAQDHIRELERERATAIRELNEYCDSQTPAAFFISELVSTGEERGPSAKTHYIQGHQMTVEWEGVRLQIYLRKDSTQAPDGISLQWEDIARHGKHVAFIPVSYQMAHIVSKDRMR